MDLFLKPKDTYGDLVQIYKYIYEYLKLFKSTLDSTVAKWSVNDLNSAFKWAEFVEEVSKKLVKRSNYNKFLSDVQAMYDSWSIGQNENPKELLENASLILRKRLLSNAHLRSELRTAIINNSFEEIRKKIPEEEQVMLADELLEAMISNEVNELTVKLIEMNGGSHCDMKLFHILIEFAVNETKNLEFINRILLNLKYLDEALYRKFLLTLMNEKKYPDLIFLEGSVELFDIDGNEKMLICYFSYLMKVFFQVHQKFNEKSLDSHLNDKFEKVIEHIVSCLQQSKSKTFAKVIRQKALSDTTWNFLYNKLKIKCFSDVDDLQNLNFDDEMEF